MNMEQTPMESLTEEVFTWWQSTHKNYSRKVALIAEEQANEVIREICGLSPNDLAISYEQCGTKGYVTLASYDGKVKKEHLSMYVVCLVYSHLSMRNDSFDLTEWLKLFLQYHNVSLDELSDIISTARTVQSYDGESVSKLLDIYRTKFNSTNDMKEDLKSSGFMNNNFNDNYGVIISSGGNNVSIHIGPNGMDVQQTPINNNVETFIDKEIKERMTKSSEPKFLLLPVRAAIEAQVPLPFNNASSFNVRYGTNISTSAWSRWINGRDVNYRYDESEINPYIRIFANLQH